MTDVNDLVGYFTGLQLVGLGKCRVGLCRRGVDVTQEVLSLVLPVEGERVSEDGTTVFLLARRVEE